MKRIFTLILFLGISQTVNADVPFPRALMNIDDMVLEFRGVFKTKIEDLGKNYITKITGPRLEYSSHEMVNCAGQPDIPPKTILAAIELFQNKTEDNGVETLRETANYYGCRNLFAMSEEVVTRGSNLIPLSFRDFREGRREFSLSPNETFRDYRIWSDQRHPIFQLTIRRTDSGIISEWKINNSLFMLLSIHHDEAKSRMILDHKEYKVDYVREYWSISYERSHGWANKVFAYKNPKGKVIYLSSDNAQVSMNSFISFTSYGLLGNRGPLTSVKKMLDYQIWFFPTTEFQSTGTASQRLLNEFQLLNTRLLNNTETTLVKNYVREFLEAIRNGQIIDKRPRPTE